MDEGAFEELSGDEVEGATGAEGVALEGGGEGMHRGISLG